MKCSLVKGKKDKCDVLCKKHFQDLPSLIYFIWDSVLISQSYFRNIFISLFYQDGSTSPPRCQQTSLADVSWIVLLSICNFSKPPRQESLRAPRLIPPLIVRLHAEFKFKPNGLQQCPFFLSLALVFIVQVWAIDIELLWFFSVVLNFPRNLSFLPWELLIQRHTTVTRLYFYAHGVFCVFFVHLWYPPCPFEAHLWTLSSGSHSLFILVQVGISYPCLLVVFSLGTRQCMGLTT